MVEREKLEDLPAYMELREDPINLLPPAFTICSTAISATGDIVFFTLLGEDGNQVLCPHISNDPARRRRSNNSVPYIIFTSESVTAAPRVLGLLFPRDRVRSCLAVSTESGLVQWVIEGHVVVNETFGVLTQGGLLPQGLAGRLLLGTCQYRKNWYTSDGKISNLNVFSSALSIEAMMSPYASLATTFTGMSGHSTCPHNINTCPCLINH